MKTLLLSTALVAASAVSAMAQTAEGNLFRTEIEPGALRASELIGMRIYNSEAAIEGEAVAGVGQDWDDLGEVNDVIVSREGEVQAVLVDIGGFLGVGERQVAVDMGALRFVADDATADAPSDFFIVMNAPRATLEEAPAYAMGEMGSDMGDAATGAAAGVAAGTVAAGAAVAEGAENATDAVADGVEATGDAMTGDATTEQATTEGGTSDQQPVVEGGTSDAMTDGTATTAGTDNMADTEVTDTAATTDTAADATTEGEAMSEGAAATTSTTGADAEAQAPATAATRQPIEREGFTAAATEAMTTEMLTGARVYDANDEWIGDVSALNLSGEGQISEAVIDVGGFLGIGEKPVAVPLADMDILQQTDGTEVRVFLQRTKEELEALPTYED